MKYFKDLLDSRNSCEFFGNTVAKLSAKNPVIFGFEDLQFADETSIAILKRLFEFYKTLAFNKNNKRTREGSQS